MLIASGSFRATKTIGIAGDLPLEDNGRESTSDRDKGDNDVQDC